jgi:hypothetical protein
MADERDTFIHEPKRLNLDRFERLRTSGEHYRCKVCGSVFSDMTGNPEYVKEFILTTHPCKK